MDPLVVISGIQSVIDVGKLLVQCCQTWKESEQEVKDRVIIVENAWHTTRLQMVFVERIPLDPDHRRVLDQLFRVLADKLAEVIRNVNSVLQMEETDEKSRGSSNSRSWHVGFFRRRYHIMVKKPKYLLMKDEIDKTIAEVEAWQRRFDPSWYLIMRLSSPEVDRELERAAEEQQRTMIPEINSSSPEGRCGRRGRDGSVNAIQAPFSAASGLRDALRPVPHKHISTMLPLVDFETRVIHYSSAKAARPRNKSSAPWYIIDSIVGPEGCDDASQDMRVLARKLTQADPLAFGLLNCKGVMQRPGAHGKPTTFDFVFRTPENMETLQSLRQFLLQSNSTKSGNTPAPAISLSRRLAIAIELAKSVSYVHTFNFVHKNIRPESVLVFESLSSSGSSLLSDDGQKHQDRSHTFLVGFGRMRLVNGNTMLRGDAEWNQNVYQHPSRQGASPATAYCMQHDVYSLGVLLLEVGLWESFVQYSSVAENGGSLSCPEPSTRLWQYQHWLKSRQGDGLSTEMACIHFREYCVEVAQDELPRRMGNRYADVVLTCLMCLDDADEEGEARGQHEEEAEIATGVNFIQNVLTALNEIKI